MSRTPDQNYGTEEPLFFNPLMPTQERVGDSLISAFMGAGITKLGDLLDHENGRWKLALEVSAQTGLRSLRLVADLLGRLRLSLPTSLCCSKQRCSWNTRTGGFL